MSYYFAKTVDLTFDQAIERVTEILQSQGFGVLTEIDVQATLKQKIDADFHKYRILGACNPTYAHKALLSEDKIGVMMPCNVIVEQKAGDKVEVAAVDPLASMGAVDNPALEDVAVEVQTRLKRVIDTL
jgi:uncharacterized protein (DUF302 family)